MSNAAIAVLESPAAATLRDHGGIYTAVRPAQDLALLAGGGTHAAELRDVDVETGDLCLGFRTGAAPALAMGATVRILLRELSGDQELTGAVVAETTSEGRESVTVRCSAPLPDRLRSHRNRRRAHRVRPSVCSPATASLRVARDPTSIDVELDDLSVLGAAILVPLADEPALAGHRSLLLEIRLPGCGATLQLGAQLCHRALRGRRVRYGLQFVAGTTPDDEAQRDAVTRYVMDRQRTRLRTATPAQ